MYLATTIFILLFIAVISFAGLSIILNDFKRAWNKNDLATLLLYVLSFYFVFINLGCGNAGSDLGLAILSGGITAVLLKLLSLKKVKFLLKKH